MDAYKHGGRSLNDFRDDENLGLPFSLSTCSGLVFGLRASFGLQIIRVVAGFSIMDCQFGN